jgi:hypothetical protein
MKSMWTSMPCICIIIPLFFLLSCASSGPVKQPESQGGGSIKTAMSIFTPGPSDTDLLQMAVNFLGASGSEANEKQARTALESLIQLHPKSKWKELATVLLHLLDERKELALQVRAERDNVEKLQAEKDQIQRETEQLKKDNHGIQEKVQAETARFQQENDQLKKDIERLKSLEIELQHREKLLR